MQLLDWYGPELCYALMFSWLIFPAQATNEIMRALGLHSNYSSLPEGERMKLLAEAISAPPPVDKIEVCVFHNLRKYVSYWTVQTYMRSIQWSSFTGPIRVYSRMCMHNERVMVHLLLLHCISRVYTRPCLSHQKKLWSSSFPVPISGKTFHRNP